jgi:hypothetical protein
MIKALLTFLMLSTAVLRADVSTTAATSNDDALKDDDVYYAPIEDQPEGATPTVQALAPGSYVSQAKVNAFNIANGKPVEGAEIFLAGQYLGRSPLQLQGTVISKPLVALSARADGFDEGSREAVQVPADGVVNVALADQHAAGWYTTPAWVVGLGLLAASAVVYDANNSAPGLAVAGGGLGIIALSQLTARFVHLPGLRKRAEAYNSQGAPAPPMEDQP